MFKRVLSAALLSLALSTGAQAQTNLTSNQSIALGGRSVVSFTVTTAGTFDLWTTSIIGPSGTTPFDPVLWIFAGLPDAAGLIGGAFIGGDDDWGCQLFAAQCGDALFFENALVNDIILGAGDYSAVIFDSCGCTETQVRGGGPLPVGPGNGGDFQFRIASLPEFGGRGTGVANFTGTVVPEPSTYMLMAAGLAGLGLVSRRRRQR